MMRLPAKGNFNGDAKAPIELLALQLTRSASNSVSVGILYPDGHGLFTPFTPCHKFVVWGLRQSFGEFGAKIKLAWPGTSVLESVVVVVDVLN